MILKMIILFALWGVGVNALSDDNLLAKDFAKSTKSIKGKIFAQYNRALRDNPKLSGKVVFDLAIGASGRLEECSIYYSDLNSKTFENRVCEIFKSKFYNEITPKPSRFKYTQEFLPY